MISALFDLISALASAFFQVMGALGRVALSLLSTVASVILWPLRALWNLLSGDLSTQWTPLYLLSCTVIFAALILLILYALWRKRQHRG